MTVTERTVKYLSIITKVNLDNRPRIVDTETGQFWPLATLEDLKETLLLMERAASGVRPYITNWFNDVFVPAFKDLNGKPNELRSDDDVVLVKERYVGVTTEQLAEKTKKVCGGLKPSSGDLLNKYLYPLINQGIVDKVPSEIDKRFNLFYPVEATTGGKNIFALFEDPDDIRLKAPTPDAYPSKNIIEDSIRFSLDFYYKEGVGNERKYRLIDVDGKEITPNELAEKYFSSPEDCFIKADETLRIERRAISNNILYSQNIQHKIIPSACNNVQTELYKKDIEQYSSSPSLYTIGTVPDSAHLGASAQEYGNPSRSVSADESVVAMSTRYRDGFFPTNLMHDPKNVLSGMLALKCLFCSSYKTPIEFDMASHLREMHVSDLVDTFSFRGKGSTMSYRIKCAIERMKKKTPVEYYDSKTAQFDHSNVQRPMGKDELLDESFGNSSGIP